MSLAFFRANHNFCLANRNINPVYRVLLPVNQLFCHTSHNFCSALHTYIPKSAGHIFALHNNTQRNRFLFKSRQKTYLCNYLKTKPTF